mmetsp:Transcript_14268/g.39379  ORF Transcript_14268/g.39379 Transcript_14268/m.39379 type:complete len:354 (+) Transcript_14268:1098-2159(+)
MSICSEDFTRRMQNRITSICSGGSAVNNNINACNRLGKELQDIASKLQRMEQTTDSRIQNAFRARSGALRADIKFVQQSIESLREDGERSKELMRKQGDIIFECTQQIMNQSNSTREIRDWHIMRFWKFAWAPEMDVYEQQANRSISKLEQQRARAERERDKLAETIKDIESDIEEKSDTMMELTDAAPEDRWKAVLESEGILSLEKDFADKRKELDVARGDVAKAAQILQMQQRAHRILSDTANMVADATGRTEAWRDLGDSMRSRLEGQYGSEAVNNLAKDFEAVGKAMLLIGGWHERNMKRLDDPRQRHELFSGYLNSMMSASFSEPGLYIEQKPFCQYMSACSDISIGG